MAIVLTDYTVPLGPEFPMPGKLHSAADFNISARVYKDDAVAQTKTAVYLPGSGSTSVPSGTSRPIQSLCAAGYAVLTAGWSYKPYGPYRSGYSEADPLTTAFFIRDSWVLQLLLQQAAALGMSAPVVIGHSKGASAAMAWAAGYCSAASTPVIKGILATGSSFGGMGGNVWNEVLRTLNRLACIVGLLDNKPYPIILSYGGTDDYAPPDFQRRLQLAIPDNSPVYMVTPGVTSGHNWITGDSQAPLAVMWADQLWSGSTITLADGVTPAVAGA